MYTKIQKLIADRGREKDRFNSSVILLAVGAWCWYSPWIVASSYKAPPVYDEKANELYAADAGKAP
jgi:hypothetical protein